MGKIDNQDGVLVPMPNGIPDAAELALLQYVLQHPEAEYGSYGGVSHVTVWQAYADNLKQAQADLEGQPDYVQRVVAAYMCLGTWGHQEAMKQLIQEHLTASLDVQSYGGSGALAPGRDSDMDGASNLEEWEQIQSSAGTTVAQQVQNYAGAAANAGVQEVPEPPAIGEGEWTAALGGSCRTWPVTLAVSPSDPTVDIRATPSSMSGVRQLPKGEPVEVPEGSVIEVRILQGEDEFLQWFAPGTLMHLSSWKEDAFTIVAATVITPQYRPERCVTLESNAYGSLEFSPAGDRPVVRSMAIMNGDDLKVTVLEGTVLELPAVPEGEIVPAIVAEKSGWEDCWTYSESATINPGELTGARVASGSLSGGTSNAMLLDGHGTAKIGEHFFHSLPFADGFWYPSPPANAPANWIQYVSGDFKPYLGYYVAKYAGILQSGIPGSTLVSSYLTNATLTNPAPTYSAVVKEQTFVTTSAECSDGCPRAYHGTVDADPAQRFYTPACTIDEGPLAGQFTQGEIVNVWAFPACRHFLQYLEVGGDCIVYEARLLHDATKPYNRDDLDLLPPVDGNRYYPNPLLGGSIYVEPLGGPIQINAKFSTCLHCGYVNHGSLRGSVPINNIEGISWFGSANTPDWYGCDYYLGHILREVARRWREYQQEHNPNQSVQPVYISSTSIQAGGPRFANSPTDQHQNGLNIDVGYVADDYSRFPLFQTQTDPQIDPNVHYSAELTMVLFGFFQEEANIAYTVPGYTGATLYGVFYSRVGDPGFPAEAHDWPGHEHHFHLTFEDPDGMDN